ncbi:hypothetical protein BH09BAC4_BH09BAC4_19110 [soil metagenome]
MYPGRERFSDYALGNNGKGYLYLDYLDNLTSGVASIFSHESAVSAKPIDRLVSLVCPVSS